MKLDVSGEMSFRTARSGGKGGQNVNKVESMVIGYFDIRHSALFYRKNCWNKRIKIENKQRGISPCKITNTSFPTETNRKLLKKCKQILERALIRPKRGRQPNPVFLRN